MENDEDIQDVIEKSREKVQRRATSKLMRDSEGQSSRNSPVLEEMRGRKKKGRPPKNAIEVDYEPSTPSNGKRKRGGKAASVTPSLNGDDEDRDAVRYQVLLLQWLFVDFSLETAQDETC